MYHCIAEEGIRYYEDPFSPAIFQSNFILSSDWNKYSTFLLEINEFVQNFVSAESFDNLVSFWKLGKHTKKKNLGIYEFGALETDSLCNQDESQVHIGV